MGTIIRTEEEFTTQDVLSFNKWFNNRFSVDAGVNILNKEKDLELMVVSN